MVAQHARLRVVDTEATREGGDIEAPLTVAGHVVEAVAVEIKLLLRLTRQRVVGKEGIVGAQPVAVLTVAPDELDSLGSLRMGHNAPLGIETIDTNALNRTPEDAVIALADRADGAAQNDALLVEAPVAKLHGVLRQHEQALAMASQPEVATVVKTQGTDLGRRLVDARRMGTDGLQALAGETIQSLSARTYI